MRKFSNYKNTEGEVRRMSSEVTKRPSFVLANEPNTKRSRGGIRTFPTDVLLLFQVVCVMLMFVQMFFFNLVLG